MKNSLIGLSKEEILRYIITFLLLFSLTAANCDDSVIRLPREATVIFKNPILPEGADPWMTPDPHGNGYYLCYTTVWNIQITHCKSPGEPGEPKVVFTPPEGSKYSKDLWAPELYYIDDEWYVYFTACDGELSTHKMYVIKGTSQDPTQPFEFIGELYEEADMFAIDGGIIRYKDELYNIWSGTQKGLPGQQLYIAHMSNPWTIDSKRVMLKKAEFEWEYTDGHVIEGPATLYRNNKIHVIYSATGGTSPNYCLGMLTFSGGDIMNPNHWIKHTEPVFEKNDRAYGTGHCSFFKGPDNIDYIVYHAKLEPTWDWRYRAVRVQPFTWRGDIPYFGTPLTPDETVKITYKKDKYTYNVASEIMHEELFDWFR